MNLSKATRAMRRYAEMSGIADFTERQRVRKLGDVLAAIKARHAAGEKIMPLFRHYEKLYGMRGLKRKYYERFLRGGETALADRRKDPKARKPNKFLPVFMTYCEKFRNDGSNHAAYKAMMADFCKGAVFAFGTWRDVFAEQFPTMPLPAACPAEWTPHGASYGMLESLAAKEAGRALALAWNRQGMFAASKHLPPVLRTRVGLAPGQVYQSDDVWHNIDVFAPGVKGVFQPLEFATYDVSSAFKVGSLMKPRTLKIDPKTGRETRDNLKQQQFRFEVANIMCCTGFHKDGVTWVGEHNTTRLNDRVLERIKAVPGWGELFRWQMSGIMNSPAHKGLLMGDGGGNPRMKALCECAHNILHNASAGLLGNRGRDAAHMHESRDAAVSYAEKTIALAESIDPALVPLLQLPILDWKTYVAYFTIIEAAVMDAHDHRLEGWADREIVEYRLDETSKWLKTSGLLDMSPTKAAAIRAVIEQDPAALMRKRRMSRREAWAAGLKDLVKWPLAEAAAFLDPGDRKAGAPGDWKTVKVGEDGTISFTDATYYPNERKVYLAQYRDHTGQLRRIAPGTEVSFYFIPCGRLAEQIWICEDEGRKILGMAPALKTAAWADPHSIEVAMGQRQQQIAELMADTRARNAESHVARVAAENVNRALIAAAKEAAARGPAPDGEGFSLEEMNEAGDGVDESGVESGGVEEFNADDPASFLSQMNAV